MKVLVALLAATAIAPAARATDRVYRDVHARSPSGRYAVHATSPDNVQPGYRPFQDEFTYRCIDTSDGTTLWTREQPMSEGGEFGPMPEEGSPVAVHVSDRGATVIRTGREDLIVVSRDGTEVGQIDLLDAFTAEENERFVHQTTAGPWWSAFSLWYFLDRPGGEKPGGGKGDGELFVVRPWWGRRVVVDSATAKLVPPDAALLMSAATKEKTLVLAALTAENEPEGGRISKMKAAYLAGTLELREGVPALRELERSAYVGSSTTGGLAWFAEEPPDGVDPHSYETFTLRQVAQLSLRRLGETPKPLPCHAFEIVRDGESRPFKIPARTRPRHEVTGQVKVGMTAERVLGLLGSPDFVPGDAWSYDMDGDAPFSLTLTFDARRVTKIERTAPLWQTGFARDEELAY